MRNITTLYTGCALLIRASVVCNTAQFRTREAPTSGWREAEDTNTQWGKKPCECVSRERTWRWSLSSLVCTELKDKRYPERALHPVRAR